MQTGEITAPRLSSPISTLADRVGRSGSHPPPIEAPVGRNRGRLQNPAKDRRLLFLLSGFVEERPPYENKELTHGT